MIIFIFPWEEVGEENGKASVIQWLFFWLVACGMELTGLLSVGGLSCFTILAFIAAGQES